MDSSRLKNIPVTCCMLLAHYLKLKEELTHLLVLIVLLSNMMIVHYDCSAKGVCRMESFFFSAFWRITPINKTFLSPNQTQRKRITALHYEWTVWRPLLTICPITNIIKCFAPSQQRGYHSTILTHPQSLYIILYSISVYICNEAASFHQSSKKLQEMIGKKL